MNADQLDRFAIRERIKNWVAWREAQDWPHFEPELRPPPSRISMAIGQKLQVNGIPQSRISHLVVVAGTRRRRATTTATAVVLEGIAGC